MRRDAQARIGELQAANQKVKQTLVRAETEMGELKAANQETNQKLQRAEAEINRLQGAQREANALRLKLTNAEEQAKQWQGILREATDLRQKGISQEEANQLREQLTNAESRIEELQAQLSLMASRGNDLDDLEEIKGIGPVFEQRLYNAGIYTYEKLAGMTPEQIRKIIRVNKSKWRKANPESWIEQARDLARQKKASKGN